jgi:predicted nucleic acid-binding protein
VTPSARALYIAEPPAAYLARPPLVVDCSLISGLVFNEHWQVLASERIVNRALHAPFLLQAEMASVAVKKSRQAQQQIAQEGMVLFQSMDISLHPLRALEVVALALRYQLSGYDAAYLWLAAELNAPLATFDEKLAAAAQTHLASLP